jgi:glycosyltransferase involved in cell wall biosynthesis
MRARGHEVSVAVGGEGPFTAALRAESIAYRSLDALVRDIEPLRDLRALAQIRAAIAEEGPDLVSLHSSKAGVLGRLACTSLGVPSVFTAHGWSFAPGIPARLRAVSWCVERSTCRLARRVIAVSEHDRRLALAGRVVARERLVRVQNGVFPLEAAHDKGTRSPTRKVVTVARFDRQKDYTTLLRALDRLRGLDWELDCLGDGPELASTRAAVARLGLAARVRCLGLRSDVARFLARADLFVLSSSWEGLPRSVLEAMCAGLPVVASDVGGTSEAVVHGETGYLFTSGDHAALAARLAELLDDQALRTRMGRRGRERYLERFTFERMFEETLAVYEGVLAEVLDDPVRRWRRPRPRA